MMQQDLINGLFMDSLHNVSRKVAKNRKDRKVFIAFLENSLSVFAEP